MSRLLSEHGTIKKVKFDVPPTVKIYENNKLNPNLFRITTGIAGLQLALWSYLSYFAICEVNGVLKTEGDNSESNDSTLSSFEETRLDKKMERSLKSSFYKQFMSQKWRLFLSIFSLAAGTVFAMTAYIYPLRMVRSVTYIRPTQALQLVTHTPWGSSRRIEVPLINVVCNTKAEQTRGQNIALKIKDHYLFFLLNPDDTYIHPLLKSLVMSRQKM